MCCAQSPQSCLTLCDPVDCSPPGSSVHGILQTRIPELVAIPFSRGSSRPRDWTQVPRSPTLQEDSFPTEPPEKPKMGCWANQLGKILEKLCKWCGPKVKNNCFLCFSAIACEAGADVICISKLLALGQKGKNLYSNWSLSLHYRFTISLLNSLLYFEWFFSPWFLSYHFFHFITKILVNVFWFLSFLELTKANKWSEIKQSLWADAHTQKHLRRSVAITGAVTLPGWEIERGKLAI